MIIRLGISASFRRFADELRRLGAPALVSANAFFQNGRFRVLPQDLFEGVDVALDSAGFVAMRHYGGYRWSPEQYVDFAHSYPWAWWASMDYCCEPEIARNDEEVRRRVQRTMEFYDLCRSLADKPPMPVLQGWEPSHYVESAEMLHGDEPLVGVGSVCRREVGGVVDIARAIDRILPAGTGVHFFGVKSTALDILLRLDRPVSVDSMAFEYRARREAGDTGRSKTIDMRLGIMRQWYQRQADRTMPDQMVLKGI